MRTLQVNIDHNHEIVIIPFHWLAPFKVRDVLPKRLGAYLCKHNRGNYYYRCYGPKGWGLAASTVEGAVRVYQRHGSIEGKIFRPFQWRGFTEKGREALQKLMDGR